MPPREVTISKALSLVLRHAAEKEGIKINREGYANVAELLAWRKLRSINVTFPEILAAVDTSDKKRFALLYLPPHASTPADVAPVAPAESSSTAVENDALADAEAVIPPSTSDSQGQDNATAHALSVKDKDPSHFLIRATQGHSLKSVEATALVTPLSLSDPDLPTTVVHGTFHAAWPLILSSGGLKSMRRHHVHFATGPPPETVLPEGKEGKPAPVSGRKEKTDVISGMRWDAQVLIYINLRKAMEAGCPFSRSENGVILSEGLSSSSESGQTEGTGLIPIEFFDLVVERTKGIGLIFDNGQVVRDLPEELTSARNPKEPGRGGRGRGKEKRPKVRVDD